MIKLEKQLEVEFDDGIALSLGIWRMTDE